MTTLKPMIGVGRCDSCQTMGTVYVLPTALHLCAECWADDANSTAHERRTADKLRESDPVLDGMRNYLADKSEGRY